MTDARTANSPTRGIEHTLSEKLGESRYQRYFARDAKLDLQSNTLRIAVKDRFYADWLAKRFADEMQQALREASGAPNPSLEWVVDPDAFDHPNDEKHNTPSSSESPAESSPDPSHAPHATPRSTARSTRPARPSRPNWKNPPLKGKLDDFIVGACNRLAFSAAQRVANDDHSVEFSMLFLHGECGVGKTHLLQGIANAYRSSKPGAKVQYVTGEAFANRYITAAREGTMARFRESFRHLDLLCIDDVHFISGKDKTQSECLHTLNDLDIQGARIVLASDEHPRRLAKLDHRLQSRLLSGMIVAMDRPDAATRRALIQRITASRGLSMDPAALGILAERCEGSARDIIGAITRIQALMKLTPEAVHDGTHISSTLVHRALQEVNASRPTRPVKVADVSRTVCAELMVDLSEMLGSSRHPRVVLARSLTALIARRLTTHSFPEIARLMHRTNHSTIINACQRMERNITQEIPVDDPLTGESVPMRELAERLRAAVLRDSAREACA